MRLPRDKGDVEAATALLDKSCDELQPHLSELLEWLQDYNWPVARPVLNVLVRCGLDLVGPITQVLHSNDQQWKYWVVSRLISEVPALQAALEPELLRLLHHPTPAEVDEGVHEEVRALFGQVDP